jgi:hypothetical protein
LLLKNFLPSRAKLLIRKLLEKFRRLDGLQEVSLASRTVDSSSPNARIGYEWMALRQLRDMNLTNTLGYLDSILDRLVRVSNTEVVPLKQFREPISAESSGRPLGNRVGVRVDACTSLLAAVASAGLYARRGVPATVFLLNSADYFKPLLAEDASFEQDMVREIALSGMEVGLHNDVLALVSEPSAEEINSTLTRDLAALRCAGVSIEGTASHNSAWSYGAENLSVFEEYCPPDIAVSHVQPVSASAHGLTWDANFPVARPINSSGRWIDSSEISAFPPDAIRTHQFLTEYFLRHPSLTRGYDAEAWLLGRDLWVIADLTESVLHFPCGFKDVVLFLESKSGYSVVLLIHGEYVSHDLLTSPLSPFS